MNWPEAEKSDATPSERSSLAPGIKLERGIFRKRRWCLPPGAGAERILSMAPAGRSGGMPGTSDKDVRCCGEGENTALVMVEHRVG
jgi:hypothetical protein